MGRGLTIFLTSYFTEMAIFLTVDYSEASMCSNCEENVWKVEIFLTLFPHKYEDFFQSQCEESMR